MSVDKAAVEALLPKTLEAIATLFPAVPSAQCTVLEMLAHRSLDGLWSALYNARQAVEVNGAQQKRYSSDFMLLADLDRAESELATAIACVEVFAIRRQEAWAREREARAGYQAIHGDKP